MDIKSLLQSLDLKSIPCEFCDVRVEETFESKVRFQNHELTTAVEESSVGAFLRVRQHGQWYFSATTDLQTLSQQLLDLANSPDIGGGEKWHSVPQDNGNYENMSYVNNNPSLIPLAEKVALMASYDKLSLQNSAVKSSRTTYKDHYKVKTYKNSSGTFFRFDFAQCGGNHVVDLAEGDKKFSDSYPIYGETFERLKNRESEFVKYIGEASQFLHAPLLTPGKYKLALTPTVAGVFVHESFGHMSEADGMIGDPVAKETWKIGKKVAADFISIVDCGDHKGGSGYCPIDDEGHKAQKNYLVKNGILTGRLHSYETALAMDEKPTGNGRAIGFEYEPIVRMTSTYIENGTMSLDELYRKAEGGVLIEDFQYGTGGDLFTIAPGRAYLIKDGKPTTPVRANVITGQIFETLLNIEAIANNFDLDHTALGGCGKNQQAPLPVADGGPTILVKDMQVS